MRESISDLLASFGVSGAVTPLPGEFDDNYRVEGPDGRYMLRVSPLHRDPADIEFENEVLRHLSGASFEVPSLADSRAEPTARLFTWVDGEPYETVHRYRGLARDLGRVAGETVTRLASMTARRSKEILWDITRAPVVIGELSGHIEDPQRRRIVEEVAGGLERLSLDDLPRQVIHNDLNYDNVLIRDGGIAGVIDVSDSLRSLRIAEPAIAAAYAMFDADDPVAVASEVLAGFAEKVEATEDEGRVVFDLILARLAMSVSISASRSVENTYHKRSETGAWDLLVRLAAADAQAVSAALEAALGHPRQMTDALIDRRSLLGPSLSLSYDEPLNIVAGRGQFLFDHFGRRYLDCVNNVAHVGHGHPHVVSAISKQAAQLNTNTRYLHEGILTYADRLIGLLPEGLDVVYLVNSGSEANELAIRLARAATGRYGVSCLEHGYHGNTSTLVDVSHYKFAGPGGDGRRDWVTVLPSPDPYRNRHFSGSEAAAAYLEQAGVLLGEDVACLIAESLPGVAGQIRPRSDVVGAMWSSVRQSGGLVIADEVQAGFGRVGEHFWSFELHGVVPDIVTMGKPIGNGHPLGAVVTSRVVAEAFDNGMEYFSTYGGNPVSAAAGNAVLDVIENECLQANAVAVGSHLMDGLVSLSHESIGDVRGAGLFVGIELVLDRSTKEPAAELAHQVVETAKKEGVLLSTDGPLHNVIKIKPPLVFDHADADRLIGVLDDALDAGP